MEFQKWPKIPRLNRDIIITEKIDGTNAQIYIMPINRPTDTHRSDFVTKGWRMFDIADGFTVAVVPGSRNRYVTLTKDNFGFAKWVNENADELLSLGIGRHYGEWWGKGIQRTYDLDERRFSLFNVSQYVEGDIPSCCRVVPKLYEGPLDTKNIEVLIKVLNATGSVAAPGFKQPEGIVIFHTAANMTFKVTIDNDGAPKGKQ